jgi:acyl dehydratase
MNSCWPSGPPAIGQAAELSRAVAPDDIERFTQISGDRNPLHYDPAAAKASRFGEIIVQGGITSAILNAVVAESLPGPGTVFLNVNWDFKAPSAQATSSPAVWKSWKPGPTNRSPSSAPP